MLTVQTCATCKGKGAMQRFEERVGGNWRKVPASVFAYVAPWHRRDAMNALAAAAPEFLRWADCSCPACDGAGEYLVEYVPCKIF